MPICPRGHESQAEDWCDFCGFPMTPPPGLAVPGSPAGSGSFAGPPGPPPAPAAPAGPYGAPPPPPPPPPGQPYGSPTMVSPSPAGPDFTADLVTCPICRTPQTGRYCEECGYDYQLPAAGRPQAPSHPQAGPAAPPPPSPPAPPHHLHQPPQHSQQAQHSQHSQQQAPQPPQHPAEPGSRPGYGYPPPAYGQQPYEQPFQQPVQQPYEQPYERGGYERRGPERGGYEPGRPAEPGGYEPGGFEQGGFEQGGYEPQPFEPQSFEPQSFEKAPPPPPAPSRPSAPAQPSQPFPDQDGYERSGPVYAQPGDDLGTSFRLAPPGDGAPGRTPGQAPPAAPVRTNWIAVVSADREYFTDMMIRSGPEAAGLFFPPYCPDRRIPLTGRGQLRIGRRSQHRGTVPEIDLSVAPEDPGASHNHAMLAEQADGSWVLVDQDSTNGTTVNGSPDPVPPHTAIPLNDGDRIHIGAWTTITVHRSA